MDQDYDAIILGTGLKEYLLAGLLSVDGKKILHMDRNSYYGGESASLNLKQLYEKFKPGQELPPHYGRWQDWNFDMVPKFMMGNGLLVRVLVHTGVHKYLEFKAVDGSYVVKGGKTYKVPRTIRMRSGRPSWACSRSTARAASSSSSRITRKTTRGPTRARSGRHHLARALQGVRPGP